MKVIKPFRSTILHRPFRFNRKNYLGVTVGVLADLSGGKCTLLHEQELWKLFGDESINQFGVEALDFGIPKPKSEVLLTAYGFGKYALDGRTAVSFRMNNIKKDLWITGNRYWIDGKATKPQPFEKIPISRAFTYGGAGFERNPMGKGKGKIQVNDMMVKELPNIESPSNPVYNEHDEYDDVSYGPLPIEYPGRNLHMGTYDQKWKEEEFPGFAHDIDWEYFNQAPPDQHLVSLKTGDRATFINMHPEKKELTLAIPPIRARAFLRSKVLESSAGYGQRVDHDKEQPLKETELRLTTTWFFPHEEKAILLYQGSSVIKEEDASDIGLILIAIEEESTPKSIDYYMDVLKQRMHPTKGPLYTLLDKNLLDKRFYEPDQYDRIVFSSAVKKKIKESQERFTAVRKRLADKGITEAQIEQMKKNSNERDLPEYALSFLSEMANQDLMLGLLEGRIGYQEFVEYQIKEIDKAPSFLEMRRQIKKRTAEVKKKNAENFPEYKESDTECHVTKDSQRTLSFISQHVQQSSFTKIDAITQGVFDSQYLADLEKKIDEDKVKYLQQIQNTRHNNQVLAAGMASNTQQFIEVSGLEEVGEFLVQKKQKYLLREQELSNKNLSFKNLSNGLIKKCSLKDIDLSNAELSHCLFEEVVFENCNFTKSNLEETVFKLCKFINCKMVQNNTNNMKFEQVELTSSVLQAWQHFRMFFNSVKIIDCDCEDFVLSRTFTENLSFESSNLTRVSMVMGRLEGFKLLGCKVESLALVLVKRASDFEFRNSRIEKLFIKDGTNINTFVVENCQIYYSGLRGLKVQGFVVIHSDFERNDLSESELIDIEFSASSFKNSMLIRTLFKRFRLKSVDMAFGLLKQARFEEGLLQRVSFFYADLGLIYIDTNSTLEDCLLERANIYPKRDAYYD